MPEKESIIIGYGNTLRGDDGVGYRVAELLSARQDVTDVAEVISCQQLAPEMAEQICRARLVIFIDADSTLAVGEVVCQDVHPVFEARTGISHHLSPGQLLGFTSVLCERAPEKAIMFSIGAVSFDLGETLSPRVKTGMHGLVQQIVEVVCPA